MSLQPFGPRSFGLTGRLMTFTRPGKDRIDKTKTLRLLTEKSGRKVSATRLFELQRKIHGNNGTSVKVVLFFRMEYSKQNRWNPSLIPVPGFRDRFSVKGTDLWKWLTRFRNEIYRPGFCVPFTQTVNRPVFPCDGVRCFSQTKRFKWAPLRQVGK